MSKLKENIVLVEAKSTGANYIRDIRELGYNPVCVELYYDDEELRKILRRVHDEHYALIDEEPPDIVFADKSYEKTLEMVKKLNPVVIIPASDEGIDWATRLAHDLGLPGNNPENLKKMTDKQFMHEALKDSNLRYIRSKPVYSFEEAKEFISQLDGSKFVVKPSVGGATVGVCVCENDDELRDALELNWKYSSKNDFETLVQEYIGGKEYSLETLCCNGFYKAIGGFYFEKIQIPGKGPVYNYSISLDDTSPIFAEIEEYNYKVVSALGIKYGILHAEYKIDEKGPVLIEINCRVIGPLHNIYGMDCTWKHHLTDASLLSYLNPDEAIKKYNKPYKTYSSYATKYIILSDEIYVIKSKVKDAFKDLDSFICGIPFQDDAIYPKTVDLSTCGGLIYLVNEDKAKLFEDIETIRKTEKFEVEKIFDIKED